MTSEYCARVSIIAKELEDAMRYRMGLCGDCRPLYVYVSHIDGGHAIGHEGQHVGFWRMEQPATIGTSYDRLWNLLARQLSSPPLYAGGAA